MIAWTTAFLDTPPGAWDRTLAYWQAVTATTLSPPRGPADEFVTLVPRDGDPFLRAQRTTAGGPGVHLDLHVADVRTAADAAVAAGAHEVAASDHVVLTSPGGMPFCFVAVSERHRPAPLAWTDPAWTDAEGRGWTSLLDQYAVDVPGEHWAAERAFWASVTGWPEQPSDPDASLVPLVRPDGLPLRVLLQRLDEPAGTVRAHLDLACDDRERETARHLALGARVERVHAQWTVLVDPTGRRYCLTDRDPITGRPA